VLGYGEDLLHRATLDDPSEVHHHDLVCHLRHHPEVMRDEDDRETGVRLQVADQVQNLGLGDHIQRGGRLVEDEPMEPQPEEAQYVCSTLQLRGTAAARPIHSGMVGKERKISMIR
jgi:hypothetical protein